MNWPTPILTIAVSIAAASANPATTAHAIELSQHESNAGDGRPERRQGGHLEHRQRGLEHFVSGGRLESVQIPSGQYVTIPSQSTGLSVSFNDGVETKSLVTQPRHNVCSLLERRARRWAIAPYDEVGRRPGGFRSR